MKISLVQNEIEEAIVDYLQQKIHLAPNQKFNIELNATRGAAGFTAEINIEKTPTTTTGFNPNTYTRELEVEKKLLNNKVGDAISNPYEVTCNTAEEPKKEAPKKSFFANLA